MELRTCKSCNTEKSITEFDKNSPTATSRRRVCRSCRNEDVKARQKTPEAREKSRIRRASATYGLSPKQYERLLEDHTHCAICGAAAPEGGNLCIDHNHETGAVRGLLCHNCNLGLGKFRDSLDLVLKAALYLEKHSES
jgi:hypothetical protein